MKVKIKILAVVDQDTREDVTGNCDIRKVKSAVKEAVKGGERSPIFRDGFKIVFRAYRRIRLSYYANGVGPLLPDDRDKRDWWGGWEPIE